MYIEKYIKAKIPAQASRSRPALGMILLSTDFSCERDFARLVRANDLSVDLYVNRIRFDNPMTVDSLQSVVAELETATADILPDFKPDAILFCCTSASAILGDEAVRNAIANAKQGVPVLTTAAACVGHIRLAGHRKVSLLAPYSAEVSRSLAGYFAQQGLEVVALNYMDIADDRDVAQLSATTIIDSARKAQKADAEALFVSCTGMRAAEILAELREAVGLPVYSSNDCSFWQAMRTLRLA